ncbi:hypothetical protein BX616_004309 [Lobosporangium transversale]|uniref:Uncharacterized protein n=1 Tax=Lobosporangium transversale TaxID=64571 RepID=A0A1Y2GUS6_9FUNG|nr:hypothetical protein BCR41DRAFT_369281 [Lobosporangium transversale]KAF9898237.1 hypothetical protein BX616_004309 [Lobosporangium transversale]ORZ21768.1 hypothetical protein BCR41DRAFT_369281 [Lobosporangium transversale]|eukprot:XP_021883019.1 hypothetical protein BCR41DRAFT_369281 [Lobosporangium transversale]
MSSSAEESPLHNQNKIVSATQPISSTAMSVGVTEAWAGLDTSTQPQLKVEPMPPFNGPSLALNLSHSLSPNTRVEPLHPQSPPYPLHSTASRLHFHSSVLSMTPTTASSSPLASSKIMMHTSQLPPMPPSLSMSHPSHHLHHHNAIGASPPGLSQQNSFELAHLNELMTGELVVSKSSSALQSSGSSNRLPPPASMPSLPNHTMFHGQASSFISMQQQVQSQPLSSTSHSNQGAFQSNQPTMISAYSTHQGQQKQQPYHCASDSTMSRGPSSSSSCSTSSSATLHQGPYQLSTVSSGGDDACSNTHCGINQNNAAMTVLGSTSAGTRFNDVDFNKNSGAPTTEKV